MFLVYQNSWKSFQSKQFFFIVVLAFTHPNEVVDRSKENEIDVLKQNIALLQDEVLGLKKRINYQEVRFAVDLFIALLVTFLPVLDGEVVSIIAVETGSD